MVSKKQVIDPAPLIEKLAARCLETKGLECSVLGNVIDMLRAAPAVDAEEVVNGRWEHIQTDRMLHVRCTACGVDAIKINTDRFTELTVAWNYCPNCGAKMDGDGNGC